MTVDLLARGMAIGINLIFIIALMRQFRAVPAARLGALFSLGAAAYALASAPETTIGSPLVLIPLIAIAAGNNVVFWLFARALFDDQFKPGVRHVLLWLLCVVLGLVGLNIIVTGVDFVAVSSLWAARTLGIGMLAGAIFVAIRGRRDDLIESRRFARVALVVVTALYAVVILAHETAVGAEATPFVVTLNAVGLAMVSAVFGAMLLRLDDRGIFATAGQSMTQPVPPAGRAAMMVDTDLVRRVEELMARDKPYRETGFSIGKLAARLDVPEYRLRRAINGGMSFRNFNSFVNSYRLGECQAALADPSQDEVSILTIALDAGFQSLATFNRAFRAATGVTPSEYRARRGSVAPRTA